MKNMKKLIAAGLSLTLALSLAACSKNDDNVTPEQTPETEQTEQTEQAPETQPEVIDYTGGYQDRVSQRATMSIVTGEDGTLGFEISWSNSAFETNEWTMSGKLSEDGTRVDYTDGKMVTISSGEPEETTETAEAPAEEQVVYENGTGHFDIADGVFTWVSDNDEFAENPVFEKIPE